MLKEFSVTTNHRSDMIPITDGVRAFAEGAGIQDGTVTVFNPHTTASIIITSFWDPNGFDDLQNEIDRLIPTRIDFKHQVDTPIDAAGHVKSAIMGSSLNLILSGGKLLLGSSQGIFFIEFDGPRQRKYYVKVMQG